MFAKFLYTDNWQDRSDHGFGLANPTWDQVANAIAALDGKQKTMLSIADREDGDHYMLIAGQSKSGFLVNATIDNLDFFSLVDPYGSNNKQIIYIGGQDGDYEERMFVPLAWVLEAAEHFFETGQMKPTMNWESDY